MEGSSVVGHMVCSYGWLADGPALMHAVLVAAKACGEQVAALLGEPAYYRRFGFRPCSGARD